LDKCAEKHRQKEQDKVERCQAGFQKSVTS
jgi:hypothetical protein